MTTFIAFAHDEETGGRVIVDIAEAKDRCRPYWWRRFSRMAAAGQVDALHVLTSPTDRIPAHRLGVRDLTGERPFHGISAGLLALAADCRRKGMKQDARLILEDLRQSR